MSQALNTNVPAGGFFKDSGEYQPGVNRLFLSFVSGASGAVPTSNSDYLVTNGFDITNNPPVRNSTGNYTATLDSGWAQYLGGGGSVRQTAGTYDAAKAFDVKIYDVDLDAKTVSFVTTRPDTGVVIDMAAGDILDICVRLGAYTEPTPAGAS